jgi:hypothetical protein
VIAFISICIYWLPLNDSPTFLYVFDLLIAYWPSTCPTKNDYPTNYCQFKRGYFECKYHVWLSACWWICLALSICISYRVDAWWLCTVKGAGSIRMHDVAMFEWTSSHIYIYTYIPDNWRHQPEIQLKSLRKTAKTGHVLCSFQLWMKLWWTLKSVSGAQILAVHCTLHISVGDHPMFGEVKTELLKGGWVSRDVTNNKHAEQGKQSKMLYK